MSEVNTNISSSDEFVTVEKFHWSDLYKKEDWLAVWIGLIVIVIAAIAVLTGHKNEAGSIVPGFNIVYSIYLYRNYYYRNIIISTIIICSAN